MKFIQLIFLFFILIQCSCFQRNKVKLVSGKVVDEKTKTPIPHKEVIVMALYTIDDKNISKNIGYFFTDSSGNFRFPIKDFFSAERYEFCSVGDTAHASTNQIVSQSDIYWNNHGILLSMKSLTIFDIKVERKCKHPAKDTLYISWTTMGQEGKLVFPYKIDNYINRLDGKIEFIGGDINATIKTRVFADQRTIVHYKLFRDGKYYGVFDTLFCLHGIKNSVKFSY